MLFFVFGLPGGFAEWCGAVTAALGRRAGEPLALIEAETLDELAVKAIRAGTSEAVVTSRRPGGRLRGALIEARRNFVVALDDPRAALVELVLGRGFDLTDAVRAVASSCAALARCPEIPSALILQPGGDPAATAAAIAGHLQIPADEAQIWETVEAVGFDGAAFRHEDAAAWWSGLDRAHREMAMGALAPYLDLRPDGDGWAVTWSGDLFWACGRPGERASGPIDITGRAHRIIEGPHIVLPPGRWSLALSLSCTREAAEHEFLVEAVADRPLAAGTVRPGHEGGATIELELAIDELTEQPLAIHVSTVRAAFDGAVSLLGVRLVATAAPGGEQSRQPDRAE